MSSKPPTENTVLTSPDEVAAVLGDDGARQYTRLLRVLRAARDMFALIPVESDLAEGERDRLLEWLGADLEAHGIKLVAVELTRDRWDPIEAMVAEWPAGEGSKVILLLGMERTPDARAGPARPRAFAILNHGREMIEKRFPVPLIVWCGPRDFSALRRHAPDFFDHFTGLVRFMTGEPALRAPGWVVPEELVEAQVAGRELDRAARANVRFYREQLADDSLSAEERLRALLGLAAALSDLPGTEGLDAAPEAARALEEALGLVCAGKNPEAYARLQHIRGAVEHHLGNHTEAAKAVHESAQYYRQLASDQPDAYEPALASALNSLGNAYHDLGRREEALEAGAEAVEIRRKLAQGRPDAFVSDLATSLNNLGAMYRALGRREEALEAATEAVEHYRKLSESRPDAFLSDLAASLNNLGVTYRDLGRRDEGLEAAAEAVEHYRKLSESRPDAFLPDLAASLNSLGNAYSDLGRRDEGLEAAAEAVEHYRKLSQARPEAFLSDLAMGLNTLGATYSDLGRREEALEAVREAIEHYRNLSDGRPDTFLSNLAGSLNNLGAIYRDVGRREEAHDLYREALDIYWPLAQKWPRAFVREFFTALRNYTKVTPEDSADPWWQRWKELQQANKARVGDQEGRSAPSSPDA